ncbi:MerR family transcriptional regulator [Nocardia sp. NPDC003345]
MTDSTQQDGFLGIGQLARRTGVPVRTIRYYSDMGLLEPLRTSGGHRVFAPDITVERLRLIRQLRGVGLSLARIRGVVDGSQRLADAVAAERVEVEAQLRGLSWQRAALATVAAAPQADRGHRLALLATVRDGDTAYDTLVAFWRSILPMMSATEFEGFLAANVPRLPEVPAPERVLAYAELVALVGDPGSRAVVSAQLWRPVDIRIRDKSRLLAELARVYDRTRRLVLESESPRAGAELDHFVTAHSVARGTRGTPAFRRRLLGCAADTDPRVRRYWRLTADITGNPATTGDAHNWLVDGLRRTLEPRRP